MTPLPSPPETLATALTRRPGRLRDRLLLRALGLLPFSLVRHLLFLLRSYPSLADRWGYHIRDIHYYEPLPDFERITVGATRRRRAFPAVDVAMASQLALYRRLGAAYRAELEELDARAASAGGFDFQNPYFSGLDAALYYSLIRDLKPARVVEVGSGFSTRIALLALQRNEADGRRGELTCIEPYPEERLAPSLPFITLVQQAVEDLPVEHFDDLAAGDILFIDSSHAVKFGGDVSRLLLEILPRLRPGVWIHIHDIFFPHDYPPEWLIDKRYAFNEQYLLEAFLGFNTNFSVRAANYWVALDHPEVARGLCGPLMVDTVHGCASFWICRASAGPGEAGVDA